MPKTCLAGIDGRRKAEREDQRAKTRELIQAELDEMVADADLLSQLSFVHQYLLLDTFSASCHGEMWPMSNWRGPVMTNSRKRKLGGLIEIGLYACLMLVFLIGCARGEWALV